MTRDELWLARFLRRVHQTALSQAELIGPGEPLYASLVALASHALHGFARLTGRNPAQVAPRELSPTRPAKWTHDVGLNPQRTR